MVVLGFEGTGGVGEGPLVLFSAGLLSVGHMSDMKIYLLGVHSLVKFTSVSMVVPHLTSH